MKYGATFLLVFAFVASAQAQCYQDRHNTSFKNGWQSTIKTQNPNQLRGISHWIMYDLGQTYEIQESNFWNLNDPENTRNGVRDVMVDISIDGIEWKEWGMFSLEESPGSSFYEGEEGPDFSGNNARYVLFTPTSNHGGSKYGIAELRINVGEALVLSSEDIVDNDHLGLSPNPATSYTNLSIDAAESGIANIQIFDGSGRVIQSFTQQLPSGENTLQLDTSEFTSGIYRVTVSLNHKLAAIELSVTN